MHLCICMCVSLGILYVAFLKDVLQCQQLLDLALNCRSNIVFTMNMTFKKMCQANIRFQPVTIRGLVNIPKYPKLQERKQVRIAELLKSKDFFFTVPILRL